MNEVAMVTPDGRRSVVVWITSGGDTGCHDRHKTQYKLAVSRAGGAIFNECMLRISSGNV